MRHFIESPSQRSELASWIQSNGEELKKCAIDIARGTDIQSTELVEYATDRLLTICEEILSNENDVEKGVASRLAEAGVLPMYGMPTMVRSYGYRINVRTPNLEH